MSVQCQQQQQTITGRVTYRRRLSSKLVFYDLLQSGGAGSVSQWWEVVVKVGTYGSLQDVKDLRDSLKLGDVVEVTGWCEHDAAHTALQAVSVRVTAPWKEQHPGIAFTPQPATTAQRSQQADTDASAVQPAHGAMQHQEQVDLNTNGDKGNSHVLATASAGKCTAGRDVQQESTYSSSSLEQAVECTPARVCGPQVSVCKFWVNTGRCAKGDSCPYLHTLLPGAAGAASRSRWLQQREVDRQHRAAEMGFVHNSSSAAKRQRAKLFAAWLVQQYGKERLNAGAGVLDVAGGSGSLTFELALVHGVKCTLVEPRPLKLNKMQHKQLQQAGRTSVISTLTLQQLQRGGSWVTAAAAAGDEEVAVSVDRPGGSTESQGAQLQDNRFGEMFCDLQLLALQDGERPAHDGQHGAAAPLCLQQVQAWFGETLWTSCGWQELFSSCSLVIGLHPDQATEPIIDYAVQQHFPFAVMPCCVFPRLFPNRQLCQPDGTREAVVTYEQLVEYLVLKGGGQRHLLDFEGANIVVFSSP